MRPRSYHYSILHFIFVGLVLYGCSSQTIMPSKALRTPSQANQRAQIIDLHFHIVGLDDSRIGHSFSVLNEGLSQKRDTEALFCISDTYSLSSPDREYSFDLFNKVNSAVNAHIVSMSASAAIYGYCGISLKSPEPWIQAESCLGLSHMKGVKLRLPGEELVDSIYFTKPLAKDDSFKKIFEQVARTVGKHKGLLLIHFSSRGPSPIKPQDGHTLEQKKANYWEAVDWRLRGASEEVKALIEISQKYPDASFIIAHSGVGQTIGLDGLERIGQFYRQHPNAKKNIFLEISAMTALTTLAYRYPEPADWHGWNVNDWLEPQGPLNALMKRFTDAWRSFGMDRIFYGSDLGGYGFSPVTDQYKLTKEIILKTPLLSDTEREDILHLNALRLIKERRW